MSEYMNMLGRNKADAPLYLSNNRNNLMCAAIGGSGGGKTTTLLHHLIQEANAGRDICIFNYHNVMDVSLMPEGMRESYEKHLVKIDVAKEGICLPLFDVYLDENGVAMESVESVQNRVTSMLAKATRLTPTQKSALSKAVRTIHERGEYKRLGCISIMDFLAMQDYQTCQHTAEKLRSILANNIFRDGHFEQSGNHIYEFDLNGLEYDDQIAVAKFMMDYFLRMSMRGKYKKRGLTLFVDECQNHDFSPNSAMYTLLNEGRKHNISVILATQSFSMTGQKTMAVILQAATLLFFLPRPDERKAIAEVIDKKEASKWVYTLAKLKRGEFVACGSFVTEEGREIRHPQLLKSCFTVEEEIELFGTDVVSEESESEGEDSVGEKGAF